MELRVYGFNIEVEVSLNKVVNWPLSLDPFVLIGRLVSPSRATGPIPCPCPDVHVHVPKTKNLQLHDLDFGLDFGLLPWAGEGQDSSKTKA